ncbi:dispersed gene family protein 1 (DGF-1), putative [Trypanosoma cruzi]|nr:dispersed gene family protein 1 (DGF-1), putative [Trypanosoma cruzi]
MSGNRFTVTRLIPRQGLEVMRPSCVAMNELAISNDSAVVLSGNVFHSVRASSSAIHVVESALRVSWRSLFAVVGNTFHMAGGDGTLIYLEGSSESSSLSVLNNSAVVIRGNLVSRSVKHFILFFRSYLWSLCRRLCFRAMTCREAWLCFIQLFLSTFTTTHGCS